jgi:mRNA-degrading endonuclease toxin of MazEF toxin-antitoxin module
VKTVCTGRKVEIAVDQIRTISKEKLERRLDELEPATAMLLRSAAPARSSGRPQTR